MDYRGHTIEYRPRNGPQGRPYEVMHGLGHVCWSKDTQSAMVTIDELCGDEQSDRSHFERVAGRHMRFQPEGHYGEGGVWVYDHNIIQMCWRIWQDRTAGR